MIEKKISNEELEKVSYSRLATNPGARTSRGESAMSGEKLKERMDEPFKLFQQKFNALVALVGGDEKGDSLIKHIPTGIGENHTLADMISDVISESAEFASYLSVGELTLLEKLVQIDKVLKGHDSHIADRVNPHGVTAEQLGLERVDNTSDEEKPLSAAVRAAFAALGGELSTAEAELIDRIAQALISAKFYADDTKVGKVGDQVIEGGLSISGDLLVEGDTFAKQIESLEVGDAVIIANADGVLLSELSGYVIRVNGDSAYAIVYDPADDCVKIGLGTYNSETKLFVFLEGEAQVLATRGAIADGHIPVWNDVKKIFEDSGKSADKVVERGADIPNGEIPVLKDGKLIGSGKTVSSFASKDSAQVVANALKGSASGTAVALKDVSPLEHILGVRVSGENIADIEAVKVRAQGKNLCDTPTIEVPTRMHFFPNSYSWVKPVETYTASADITVYPEDMAVYRFFDLQVYYTDGTYSLPPNGRIYISNSEESAAALRDGKTRHYSVSTDVDKTKKVERITISPLTAGGSFARSCKAENIQLEIGTETEYEPYKEPIEYTVSPDGTVDGVKSIAPATTLTTDTEGVLIEVEYNRNINDAFAELKQAIILLGGII